MSPYSDLFQNCISSIAISLDAAAIQFMKLLLEIESNMCLCISMPFHHKAYQTPFSSL